MSSIVFIADLFAEHVNGGGELNNEELIKTISARGYDVVKKQSMDVDVKFLRENSDCFFIISNFIGLSFECRSLISNYKYILYEHDHKYLKSRNPAVYKDFIAPPKDIINYTLYKNAMAVLCQSKFHKDIIESNLNLKNVVNLGGNLWSVSHLELLRQLGNNDKSDFCSIMQSQIPHKNTLGAIRYCSNKSKKYKLIPQCKYEDFLTQLSKNKRLVFLPQTPETLSRIVVEARMMGVSIITNNLVGATSESWFKLKGDELIDFMIEKRQQIVDIVEGYYKADKATSRPSVSMITTFHEGEKFLEKFLHNMTSQTIFHDCELIMIDAASPGREQNIVEKYTKRYKNIIYKRLEEKEKITPCLNLGLELSNGEYITFSFIDDVKKNDCIEILLKNITENPDVDLVYGDTLQTKIPNETFENNSSGGSLFNHSMYEFSRQNMIKCLPGPMPLWKKKIHDMCGFFDTDSDYTDDWEMWLRAVESGCKFKKVDEIVGLYYAGGRSFDSESINMKQRKEEAKLFYKYSTVFGENFFNFKPYFDQFI